MQAIRTGVHSAYADVDTVSATAAIASAGNTIFMTSLSRDEKEKGNKGGDAPPGPSEAGQAAGSYRQVPVPVSSNVQTAPLPSLTWLRAMIWPDMKSAGHLPPAEMSWRCARH